MMVGRSLRILVLEDHAFQRASLVGALYQLGCTKVFEASDGAEALSVLEKTGPVDIAICDLQMEGKDGVQFLYRISGSALVRSIVINSMISPEVRRSIHKIVPLLGLHLLGDLGKIFNNNSLEQLLNKYEYNGRQQALSIEQQGIRLEAESEVRRAFAANEVVSYYQPKFNLKTSGVIGIEVLARWPHLTRGLIASSSFISVLEDCNLMEDLFFAQLEQGLSLQKKIFSQGKLINFALKMRSGLLLKGDLHERVGLHLREYGLHGSGLTFELTEDKELDMNPVTLGNLVRLRMLGCRLSIDNFGYGHSSLQRLCDLPINEIKIGFGFVSQLNNEPRCRAVISSSLALGASLGMPVIIEGIETTEQKLQLLELGCMWGQGSLYACPMSANELLQWLNARQCERAPTY
ncbi:diguanylate cyclase/phosphodiesterase [Pseudomonas chlororaphis subsp. piscium]|uniref:EAL domain-containing response regulator n=1 Tax=Pseudomonas chlororaphis TaxID=587753 RepID=UPI000F6DB4FE|nr:EAL domain-containing protein [Pseudomonas chlororaphis]AZC51715.1 diguanylate cyclase/phosphodiesterase [Pseudomonas chlororaphis subsp. piscium]